MSYNEYRSDSPDALREARQALIRGEYLSSPQNKNKLTKRVALGVAGTVLALSGVALATNEGPSDAQVVEAERQTQAEGLDPFNPNDPGQVEARVLERVAQADTLPAEGGPDQTVAPDQPR